MSLLVGGPDDGRWARVERNAHGNLPKTWTVPNPRPSGYLQHEVYILTELVGDGTHYHVYRHSSLTVDKTLARLIKGYTPREVEL